MRVELGPTRDMNQLAAVAAVQANISTCCSVLVQQAARLHRVRSGRDSREMTAALREIYKISRSLLTGAYEDVVEAPPITYLTGTITNLLQYSTSLENDSQAKEREHLLTPLIQCVRDLVAGIDASVGLN